MPRHRPAWPFVRIVSRTRRTAAGMPSPRFSKSWSSSRRLARAEARSFARASCSPTLSTSFCLASASQRLASSPRRRSATVASSRAASAFSSSWRSCRRSRWAAISSRRFASRSAWADRFSRRRSRLASRLERWPLCWARSMRAAFACSMRPVSVRTRSAVSWRRFSMSATAVSCRAAWSATSARSRRRDSTSAWTSRRWAERSPIFRRSRSTTCSSSPTRVR